MMILASLSSSLYAGSISTTGTAVGTSWRSIDADANGDGFGGGRSSAPITGLGGFDRASAQNDLLHWAGDVCFNDMGVPNALKLIYEVSTLQLIHQSGDQVFFALDETMDSFVCIEFDDNAAFTGHTTSLIHRVVTGGTGRFEDATGSQSVTTSGVDLGPFPAAEFAGHGGFEAELSIDLEY